MASYVILCSNKEEKLQPSYSFSFQSYFRAYFMLLTLFKEIRECGKKDINARCFSLFSFLVIRSSARRIYVCCMSRIKHDAFLFNLIRKVHK